MTAEEKALKAYPILIDGTDRDFDYNDEPREAYIEGYTQAYKDFLNKACEWLDAETACYVNVTHPGGIETVSMYQNFIDDFRKAMNE